MARHLQDWAAATDYLRILAKTQPISLKGVAVVGHSAGAHAALWLGSRSTLPSNGDLPTVNPLTVAKAIAIDGPGELAPFIGFDAEVCGKPVIASLLGGLPNEVPARYKIASPIENPPTKTKYYLIASAVLTSEAAAHFQSVAKSEGQSVSVLNVVDGGHFDIIAPGSKAWNDQVKPFIASALK